MSKQIRKLFYAVMITALVGTAGDAMAAHHWHGHGGGWHRSGGVYFSIGVPNNGYYYDDSYYYPDYYYDYRRCRVIPGHWYRGYWVPAHRVCYR